MQNNIHYMRRSLKTRREWMLHAKPS